jgi:hypothetical protein
MYVPTANDPNVVYDGVSENDVLNAINTAGLGSWQGRVMPRNHHTLPWTKQLDMRIAQEIPTFVDGHKLFVYFDVLNLMNFIDDEKVIRSTIDTEQEAYLNLVDLMMLVKLRLLV